MTCVREFELVLILNGGESKEWQIYAKKYISCRKIIFIIDFSFIVAVHYKQLNAVWQYGLCFPYTLGMTSPLCIDLLIHTMV